MPREEIDELPTSEPVGFGMILAGFTTSTEPRERHKVSGFAVWGLPTETRASSPWWPTHTARVGPGVSYRASATRGN